MTLFKILAMLTQLRVMQYTTRAGGDADRRQSSAHSRTVKRRHGVVRRVVFKQTEIIRHNVLKCSLALHCVARSSVGSALIDILIDLQSLEIKLYFQNCRLNCLPTVKEGSLLLFNFSKHLSAVSCVLNAALIGISSCSEIWSDYRLGFLPLRFFPCHHKTLRLSVS